MGVPDTSETSFSSGPGPNKTPVYSYTDQDFLTCNEGCRGLGSREKDQGILGPGPTEGGGDPLP